MNTLTKIVFVSAFAAVVALMPIAAKADPGDWSTRVTISQPMEVGNLVLSPGKYIFRRMDVTEPNAIEIYSAETTKCEGFVMGIPAYRTNVSDKSTLILQEGKKGAPESLQYWFYPDNANGLEFLSPHAHTARPASLHTAG